MAAISGYSTRGVFCCKLFYLICDSQSHCFSATKGNSLKEEWIAYVCREILRVSIGDGVATRVLCVVLWINFLGSQQKVWFNIDFVYMVLCQKWRWMDRSVCHQVLESDLGKLYWSTQKRIINNLSREFELYLQVCFGHAWFWNLCNHTRTSYFMSQNSLYNMISVTEKLVPMISIKYHLRNTTNKKTTTSDNSLLNDFLVNSSLPMDKVLH